MKEEIWSLHEIVIVLMEEKRNMEYEILKLEDNAKAMLPMLTISRVKQMHKKRRLKNRKINRKIKFGN